MDLAERHKKHFKEKGPDLAEVAKLLLAQEQFSLNTPVALDLDGEVKAVAVGSLGNHLTASASLSSPVLKQWLELREDRGTEAAFVLTLMKDSKVRFKVAAMPQADNFQLGIWALLNQQEREQISRRTKEALAAAKARGVKLGGTGGSHASLSGMNAARSRNAEAHKATVRPLANHLRQQGMTLQAIADTLNASGSRTASGCEWRPTQVSRVLRRLPADEAAYMLPETCLV